MCVLNVLKIKQKYLLEWKHYFKTIVSKNFENIFQNEITLNTS